ncbi:MAG: hypothetical protein LUH02_09925, partial [Erysipelotrichaceae bacterium]|nr:hypothetical protein [Erysipelotrichaceae bacterium]
ILPHVHINTDLKQLIIEVRNDRTKSKNNPSAQPEYDISKLLNDIIHSKFYESDYNTITKKILYENMSYEESIKKGIAIVAQSKIF